jgi:hypothetical protein
MAMSVSSQTLQALFMDFFPSSPGDLFGGADTHIHFNVSHIF